MQRVLRIVLAGLMVVWSPAPAVALVVDGETIEDIYGYILKVLEEDQAIQEQYREQAARNPSYRGYRPYTYSSLRHLSTEDLLYGALQGSFAALRQHKGADYDVLEAKVEANINVVMELFPMLARDFTVGDQLLGYMQGKGGDEFFRNYLLRRCEPGYARDSLFARFWQDCLQRHEAKYEEVLQFIAGSPSTEPRSVMLALELYTGRVERAFESGLRNDPGVAAWLETQEASMPPHELAGNPKVIAVIEDRPGYMERLQAFQRGRVLVSAQLDPALQRPEWLRNQARDWRDRLDTEYPILREMAAEEAKRKSESPGIPGPPVVSDAPPPPPPPQQGLGIPTLDF